MRFASHICLIFTLLLISLSASSQVKRGVVIGIGDYPKEYGWSKIHGNNDVGLIKETLREQGFMDQNIVTLIDSEATYDAIMLAFQRLLEVSAKDDVIYIHFSGHGQRITDVDGDEKDDMLDEAWIPYDARISYQKGVYEGERHITDDWLNGFLTSLRIKVGTKGKIIVVADACHSGSGTRGMESEECCRGVSDVFSLPYAAPNIIRKQNRVEWLYVAACQDYETNYEYRDDDGQYYGSLSYSIAESSGLLASASYRSAIEIWKKSMKTKEVYPQNLDDEGRPTEMNAELF